MGLDYNPWSDKYVIFLAITSIVQINLSRWRFEPQQSLLQWFEVPSPINSSSYLGWENVIRDQPHWHSSQSEKESQPHLQKPVHENCELQGLEIVSFLSSALGAVMPDEEVGETAGNGSAFSCGRENFWESLDSDRGAGGSFTVMQELMQLSVQMPSP